MSLEATRLVWAESRSSANERLVLLAIADKTGSDGVAWPSQDKIATMTGLSERTVGEAVRSLKARGEILVSRTGRAKGSRNVYRLTLGALHERQLRDNLPPWVAEAIGKSRVLQSAESAAPTRARSLPLNQSLEPVPPNGGTPDITYDPLKGARIEGRNLPFDALAEETGSEPIYDSKILGEALRRIRKRAVGHARDQGYPLTNAAKVETALADAIRARASAYRERWPGIELTPTALAKHWDRVLTEAPAKKHTLRFGRGVTTGQLLEEAERLRRAGR